MVEFFYFTRAQILDVVDDMQVKQIWKATKH